MEIEKTLHGEESTEALEELQNLSLCKVGRGYLQEARELQRDILGKYKQIHGNNSSQTLSILAHLALTEVCFKNFEDAKGL